MRFVQVILACGMAICLSVLAAIASADCAAKRYFDSVQRHAGFALDNRLHLTGDQARHIQAQLTKIMRLNLASDLRRANLHAQHAGVRATLMDLLALAEVRDPGQTALTRHGLSHVSSVFDRLCAASRNTTSKPAPKPASPVMDGVKRLIENALQAPANGQSNYFILGFLPVLIASACGLFLVSWKAAQWVLSLVFLRRSCKIPATLIVGTTRTAGHMILLGRLGNRFEAISGTEMSAMTDYLASRSTLPRTEILVGEKHLHAKLHMVSSPYCVTFFRPALSRRRVRALFDRSLIPTRMQPKRRVKPNLEKINPRFA